MFRIKSCKAEPVTVELAKFFQEMIPLEGDRALKKERCKHLGKCVLDGMAIPFIWAYAVIRNGGGPIRLNGAHSTEVILSGQVSLKGLWAFVACIEADTMEDAALAWAQFDAMKSARSAPEVGKSIAETFVNMTDIHSKIKLLCAVGFDFDLNDGRPGAKTTPQDRMIAVGNQEKKVRFVNGVLLNPLEPEVGVKFLQRGPVVAAMSRTFEKCASSAEAFWSAVRDNTDLDPASPTRRLHKILNDYTVASGGGSKGSKKGIAPEVMFGWCIIAWNAYRTKDFDFEFGGSNFIPKAA